MKYRFVPVDEDTRQRLLKLREELDCIDEDSLDFTEPPYDEPDNANDLVKHESPHDPHRSPERKFDSTVRELLRLARSHPDTDLNITVGDIMQLKQTDLL
jgi:hypothetical protein